MTDRLPSPDTLQCPFLCLPNHAVRFEEDWYIVGYFHRREEIRTFSLSRMISVEQTGKQLVIPNNFDFKNLSGSRFGVHWGGEEINVEILFPRHVADYVKERTWHPSQTIIEHDNGDVILALTANHLMELKRWILSWGNAARVLAPDDLVREIRQTLVDATKSYS